MGAPKDQDQMININIILPNLLNVLTSTGDAEGAASVRQYLEWCGISAHRSVDLPWRKGKKDRDNSVVSSNQINICLGSSAENHHLEISLWDFLSKTLFDKEFDNKIVMFQGL